MTTKLDQEFVKTIRHSKDFEYGFETLVNEVERLEGEIRKIELLIDPSPSPGGDTVWLVANALKNLNEAAQKQHRRKRTVMNNFDHPCKDTCSGWQQGFERGKGELTATQAKLEEARKRFKERGSLLEEVEQHFAHGSSDDGVDLWRRISDELGNKAILK